MKQFMNLKNRCKNSMNNYHFLFLFLVGLFVACNNTDDDNVPPQNFLDLDCSNFTTALLELNENSLATILNPELEQFDLLDQDNDTCLHDNNLQAFTDALNDTCEDLNASVICCGCIETLPTISKITIQIESAGIEVTRIIDLFTPDENGVPLSFAGVHY